MLDLTRVEQFARRFTVRDRRTNRPVPFCFNPSQLRIHENLKQHVAKGRRAFVIVLKGRRLGISTWARFLQLAHGLEKDYAEPLILGQKAVTAKALYREVVGLAQQLPMREGKDWKFTQEKMEFFDRSSVFTWQTAGNVVGTRGLGFTMLHATEAAYYVNRDVFPAVFSTLSDDPENAGIIETTPNGIEGPGQAYYELWNASKAGETEYLAQFLPWHEDPDYIADARTVKDAPRDEYEKFLMKDLGLGKERVAFYRITLKSKCDGSLDRWRREYPGNDEEAFMASGDPVFNFEDISAAEKWSTDVWSEQAELQTRDGHRASIVRKDNGRFTIYEKPAPGAHYFIGVVVGHAARNDDGSRAQDMLAAIAWNGETGKLAAMLHCVLEGHSAAHLVYSLGCFYNRGMVATEDSQGGYGTKIFQEMRDRLRYPNQYKWKGRNDKVSSEKSSQSLGFTFTQYTRKMAVTGMLTALRRQEIIPSDSKFVEQMQSIQWEPEGWRFEAIANLDEVFWAGALGWVARDQWHPRPCHGYATQETLDDEELFKAIPHKKVPLSTEGGILTMNLQGHLDQVKKRSEQRAEEA
jgi:hypothetical protein